MTKTLSDADYIRYARMVDARTWPVIDRYLARRGMTREQLMARQQPHPAPGPAGGRAAGATGGRPAGAEAAK